jgi:hypothetical protein
MQGDEVEVEASREGGGLETVIVPVRLDLERCVAAARRSHGEWILSENEPLQEKTDGDAEETLTATRCIKDR